MPLAWQLYSKRRSPPEPANSPMASDEFSGNYMEKHRTAQLAADFFPGSIRETRHPQAGTFEFLTDNGVLLRVQLVAEGIVRFRFSPEGRFDDDFSYALDPAFTPALPE